MELYRNAALWFAALTAFAFLGFWQSYFSKPFDQPTTWAHVHGLAMLTWCALLISQAWLVRTGRRALHRDLGKLSYVVVPVIVFSTLGFAHFKLEQRGLTPGRLFTFFIQMQLLAFFLVAYVQAIRHRRRPLVHAQYMVCTALPLIDPVFARVIIFWLWKPDPIWLCQVITYTVTDCILIALFVATRRTTAAPSVFPGMLALSVTLHILNFIVPKTQAWAAFARAFTALPF